MHVFVGNTLPRRVRVWLPPGARQCCRSSQDKPNEAAVRMYSAAPSCACVLARSHPLPGPTCRSQGIAASAAVRRDLNELAILGLGFRLYRLVQGLGFCVLMVCALA